MEKEILVSLEMLLFFDKATTSLFPGDGALGKHAAASARPGSHLTLHPQLRDQEKHQNKPRSATQPLTCHKSHRPFSLWFEVSQEQRPGQINSKPAPRARLRPVILRSSSHQSQGDRASGLGTQFSITSQQLICSFSDPMLSSLLHLARLCVRLRPRPRYEPGQHPSELRNKPPAPRDRSLCSHLLG